MNILFTLCLFALGVILAIRMPRMSPLRVMVWAVVILAFAFIVPGILHNHAQEVPHAQSVR